MAERPIFIPRIVSEEYAREIESNFAQRAPSGTEEEKEYKPVKKHKAEGYIGVGVIVKPVEFTWFAGFAPSQKMKSVASLHEAAKRAGYEKVLEISSKGNAPGQRFSAFNLDYRRDEEGGTAYKIENIFQGSKVFANGGPYTDLYDKTPLEAKKDARLRSSGALIGFDFFGEKFPLEPKTFFYDYIYIHALRQKQNMDLANELLEYDAFTDIEFNPEKSINCQAYSAAFYVFLFKTDCMKHLDIDKSKEGFLDLGAVQEEYARRKISAPEITPLKRKEKLEQPEAKQKLKNVETEQKLKKSAAKKSKKTKAGKSKVKKAENKQEEPNLFEVYGASGKTQAKA